jgi:hypothetical protein
MSMYVLSVPFILYLVLALSFIYLPQSMDILECLLLAVYIMQDSIPESIESVAELMTPPSPDSSYGFHVPGEKELAKEPPKVEW